MVNSEDPKLNLHNLHRHLCWSAGLEVFNNHDNFLCYLYLLSICVVFT